MNSLNFCRIMEESANQTRFFRNFFFNNILDHRLILPRHVSLNILLINYLCRSGRNAIRFRNHSIFSGYIQRLYPNTSSHTKAKWKEKCSVLPKWNIGNSAHTTSCTFQSTFLFLFINISHLLYLFFARLRLNCK